MEKAVVVRVWLGTSDAPAGHSLEQLQQAMDFVMQDPNFSLPAPATHAAQTLIWKKIEETTAREQYNEAEAWCQLCLHPIFEKAGTQNKVKITRYRTLNIGHLYLSRLIVQRKLIHSALSRQDYAAAHDAYLRLPESSRDEPLTRYLMYKVSLRSERTDFGESLLCLTRSLDLMDLAAECLDIICRSSAKDATLLYACVMEAQSRGDKGQAIVALQRVFEKYNNTAPVGLHLPALLR